MKEQIKNIKAQIKALYLTNLAEDFSEAWGEIKDYGNDFDDEAQEEMESKAKKAAADYRKAGDEALFLKGGRF